MQFREDMHARRKSTRRQIDRSFPPFHNCFTSTAENVNQQQRSRTHVKSTPTCCQIAYVKSGQKKHRQAITGNNKLRKTIERRTNKKTELGLPPST
mmetsp:Transcript_5587/g.11073  ORF Transcript_5587/g.11073 Transcript_5587/m.11073 type:complete len:96 (-) Transcript_5587:2118-2405(-)